MKKLYYMLDFSAFQCFFQIRVNDVEIFSFNVEGQTSIDIPINQGILESGECTVEVKVFPLQGKTELHEKAYAKYKVTVFDLSSGDFVFVEQFEEQRTPPAQKAIPFTQVSSLFYAEVPYKIDAWQNGINLKDVNFNLKEKLLQEYQKILNRIAEKQYSEIEELYRKKEENTATVMYLNEEEKKERMSKLFNDFSSGFEPVPLSKDSFVEYSAYGKRVCLKNLDGLSALRLENKETEEDLVLDIAFYIPKGKTEFEVI